MEQSLITRMGVLGGLCLILGVACISCSQKSLKQHDEDNKPTTTKIVETGESLTLGMPDYIKQEFSRRSRLVGTATSGTDISSYVGILVPSEADLGRIIDASTRVPLAAVDDSMKEVVLLNDEVELSLIIEANDKASLALFGAEAIDLNSSLVEIELKSVVRSRIPNDKIPTEALRDFAKKAASEPVEWFFVQSATLARVTIRTLEHIEIGAGYDGQFVRVNGKEYRRREAVYRSHIVWIDPFNIGGYRFSSIMDLPEVQLAYEPFLWFVDDRDNLQAVREDFDANVAAMISSSASLRANIGSLDAYWLSDKGMEMVDSFRDFWVGEESAEMLASDLNSIRYQSSGQSIIALAGIRGGDPYHDDMWSYSDARESFVFGAAEFLRFETDSIFDGLNSGIGGPSEIALSEIASTIAGDFEFGVVVSVVFEQISSGDLSATRPPSRRAAAQTYEIVRRLMSEGISPERIWISVPRMAAPWEPEVGFVEIVIGRFTNPTK